MQTNYIFLGTYALDNNSGRYFHVFRSHCCNNFVATHDGTPSNEAKSIHSAITKIEDALKEEWIKMIMDEHNCDQATAEATANQGYWLSRSLTPSLSGQNR